MTPWVCPISGVRPCRRRRDPYQGPYCTEQGDAIRLTERTWSFRLAHWLAGWW